MDLQRVYSTGYIDQLFMEEWLIRRKWTEFKLTVKEELH